jgi:hypothetical protein
VLGDHVLERAGPLAFVAAERMSTPGVYADEIANREAQVWRSS